jgi:hypothetical protein
MGGRHTIQHQSKHTTRNSEPLVQKLLPLEHNHREYPDENAASMINFLFKLKNATQRGEYHSHDGTAKQVEETDLNVQQTDPAPGTTTQMGNTLLPYKKLAATAHSVVPKMSHIAGRKQTNVDRHVMGWW